MEEIKKIEEDYAKTETPVVSNNSAHRVTPDVPMLLPELNADHAKVIERKKYYPARRLFGRLRKKKYQSRRGSGSGRLGQPAYQTQRQDLGRSVPDLHRPLRR